MSHIVKGLNTFSNNFIADMLLKKLGTETVSRTSGVERGARKRQTSGVERGARKRQTSGVERGARKRQTSGVERLASYLRQKVGITSQFVLRDGSGLSADNRLSARQLSAVLRHVAQRMDIFPDFIASLPASGLEGTVEERLHEHKGLIRAKTATLTVPVSVSGLAGYYRSPRQGLVTFIILANGVRGKKQPPIAFLQSRQDRLLSQLMKNL